ncbi:hypothetical protein C6Q15_28230 [Burkholderia multivorans]|uniref:Uncharacterized protein n=1 Tax=Burkholderia multivorans TaxID=87883 RepID=A0A2S9MBE2_9BURK|nr:hypothetical protein C6Q15_28230 [Burkholderia multivorans]
MLTARVADLLHLLEFATIYTPTEGDGPQIIAAIRDIKAFLAAHPGQPEPRAEVTDEQIADMFERVTGYSIENGRAALNDADILGFARELLDAARAGEAS